MPKQSIIVAIYDGTEIQFNDAGWFNATMAAEKFGKRPNDWMSLDSTKEYLAVLAEEPTYQDSWYVKTSKARSDRGGGTWFHPMLAVPFSRWLDVRFAVWCDKQIDALIRGNHPINQWKRMRHEAASTHKVMCAMLNLSRKEEGKETESHHYSNEARLVNWALTGEFKGLNRDELSISELDTLAKLEEQNAVMIGHGVPYQARKPALDNLARVLTSGRLIGGVQ